MSRKPQQKCFEGYEHTGEFRLPIGGEIVQSYNIPPKVWITPTNSRICIECWILRKIEENITITKTEYDQLLGYKYNFNEVANQRDHLKLFFKCLRSDLCLFIGGKFNEYEKNNIK